MHEVEKWSSGDFDRMSWHDVHVHGFRLVENEGGSGSAELFLDIDYILEWRKAESGFEFVVAQATLQFHEVFGLKFVLDYATPTAGMCAFSLDGIQREQVTYPTGYTSFHWRLGINWPNGCMEFRSPGFSQWLTGPRYTQSTQSLDASRRNVATSK
ncbi:hypothetical protein [Dokdonella sp.]|uniref:hypothetical protein n=1 Tax=Dokdonella sp. TaxID=2291710 RepID=UPI0037837DF0